MSDTQYIVDAPAHREMHGGHQWEVPAADGGVETVTGYVITGDADTVDGFEGGEIVWEGPASDAKHVAEIEGIIGYDANGGPGLTGC